MFPRYKRRLDFSSLYLDDSWNLFFFNKTKRSFIKVNNFRVEKGNTSSSHSTLVISYLININFLLKPLLRSLTSLDFKNFVRLQLSLAAIPKIFHLILFSFLISWLKENCRVSLSTDRFYAAEEKPFFQTFTLIFMWMFLTTKKTRKIFNRIFWHAQITLLIYLRRVIKYLACMQCFSSSPTRSPYSRLHFPLRTK